LQTVKIEKYIAITRGLSKINLDQQQ